MSLRLVPPLCPPLAAGTPGDPGLTGPGSVTWRVCRERVVPLGGLSALLLQLAHPLVAAGVAEHSSFRADPAKRLMLTLRESERFGQLYGVGKDIRPVSYQDFQDYYATTLSRLTPGDQARSIARMILRARLRRIPISPWGYLLAAGLLPAPLRARYGLRWSAAQRALWWLFTHAVHVVMCRLAPARLRFWDHYRVAVVRCRPAADPSAALPSAARPSRDDLAR
jgi:uncharacterized protein (DUF2236 family)